MSARCRHWPTLNKSYTSRDYKWQEFLRFLAYLGIQRVYGVLVIDAKAIYDSMYGASGPLAMEEKRTAIEMMGIPEGMRRENVIPRWCHGEAHLSDELDKETVKKTQLELSMAVGVYGVLYMTKT